MTVQAQVQLRPRRKGKGCRTFELLDAFIVHTAHLGQDMLMLGIKIEPNRVLLWIELE